MKITRDRPCQRRHHRLCAPLLVKFGDHETVEARDWSIGGLGFCLEHETPHKGDLLCLILTLPFQGYDISFDVDAKVMRTDANSEIIGVEFVDLSERSSEIMGYFGEDLIRGRMGTIDDSICRIDVPVTPISTSPTTAHASETPLRRLPIKTILMSSLYIVLGLLVFGYLGVLAWSSLMRLEVPSSVVSAQLQTFKMPVDGLVRQVNFEVGEDVAAGEEIMRFEDRKLEGAINATRIKIETAERNVWRMKQRHRIEAERLKLYQIVNSTDKDIAAARLVAAKEVLAAADTHLLRISKLKKAGAATNVQLESARREQVLAEADVRELSLLLEKNTAMDEVSGRRHYNHKEFGVDLDLLALDLDTAYSALEAEVRKLEDLDRRKERLVLRAPFDGRIVNLYQTGAGAVGRDEPLLLLERRDNITVTAFLNQGEILQVGMFDEASVFIPALGIHLPGQVVKIDRNSLVLDKSASHYTWQDDEDRTAAVVLRLGVNEMLRERIRGGLPAVVIFDRRGTSAIWSRLKGVVGLKSSSRRFDKYELKNKGVREAGREQDNAEVPGAQI